MGGGRPGRYMFDGFVVDKCTKEASGKSDETQLVGGDGEPEVL